MPSPTEITVSVAHPREEQARAIHVPLRTDELQDTREVGVAAYQRPGTTHRCRRRQDGAAAARIAQPAPEKRAPGSAATMKRHDERPSAIGHVVLGNVEPDCRSQTTPIVPLAPTRTNPTSAAE